jgi:glycosyltransferase involved in cell wall biosynthesis
VRILELGKFYAPERGGIETLLKSWCERFVASGDEVECVVANRGPRTIRERIDGVAVTRLASFGSAASTSLCPSYPFAIRSRRCDIAHTHFPNPLADLAAILAPRRTKVVVSWHSDIVRQRAMMAVYRHLQNAMLRRADRIVVATPNHLEYSAWLPRWQSKVAVIPFGLELSRFESTPGIAAAAARLRAGANGRTILLNVGRLVGYKGQRYAVSAMRGLEGAELWIVGSGPLEASLRAQAAAEGVADKVRFLGDAEDGELPALYHACDIFLFPSITPNEAFGLVQVEAMACAKPVIACNLRSGVPWVCRHGETGLVVPPEDAPALNAAVLRLLRDPDFRRKLGTSGRVRAFSEFEASVMASRYRSLFTTILSAGGGE